MRATDPIIQQFRLTPVQQSALKRLGLVTLEDLLRHFPVRHERAGEGGSVAALESGQHVTLYGQLSRLEAKKLWKSKRNVAQGYFEDGTGRIKVLWFNQPYIAKMVPMGVPVRLTGTVAGKDKPYITNPEIEPISRSAIPAPLLGEPDGDDTLYPVYPETKGITSRWFYHAVRRLFEAGLQDTLDDPIPADVAEKLHLPALPAALIYMHTPQNLRDAEAARKRFAFEEIFVIQASKRLERGENDAMRAPAIDADEAQAARFAATFPYALTGAQKRAIAEIFADFRKPHPMARLLEGDVGAGKTAVAAVTSYAAVTSRPAGRESGTLQVAYMAPTEILAGQHFRSFIEYFKELPISLALITGSGCWKYPSKVNRTEPTKISRAQLLKWVAGGEIAMVVGTHALIQKTVKFRNLAYAIVDEQHRFGTRQRQALAQKNSIRPESDAVRGAGNAPKNAHRRAVAEAQVGRSEEARRSQANGAPHFLSMTATPIPRTLALTIYGDLDISVLDELPPQRAGITTTLVKKSERDAMYAAIRRELAAGRQAYIVCPRIDEPDPAKEMALQAKSAIAEAKRLAADVFPEYAVGLIHGKMKPDEKDAAMAAFAANETQILVATSVIEVGVNVPNATVIAIEGAERFGLSQLHQLRGRVRRSAFDAFCYLLPDTSSQASLSRLRALERSADGFALAEADLANRGAGDLYGRSQWGVSDLGMEALKNPRLIEAARAEAAAVLAADPALDAHPALRARTRAIAQALHQE
ncbi:MAG TPA: ATP-dependent DNA helicase RecG [Candidatus Paceibacterota bacterium]|nr:ATP-dependent DNA helicase RecG [Candidatus Paceibacterota bacterium]